MFMLIYFSRVWLFATLWIAAYQAPLSIGFSKHEYWSGFPCCPPGDLPDPRIEPVSSALHLDSFHGTYSFMPKNICWMYDCWLLCGFWGHLTSKNTEVVCHSLLHILTECGPLEKGMANHFSILALRTPWTVWKGKMIGYWKRNSPGQ